MKSWKVSKSSPVAHFVIDQKGPAVCGYYRRPGWERDEKQCVDIRCKTCKKVLEWLPRDRVEQGAVG